MRERVWGSLNSDEGTYTIVLCIYKYFVLGAQGDREIKRIKSESEREKYGMYLLKLIGDRV